MVQLVHQQAQLLLGLHRDGDVDEGQQGAVQLTVAAVVGQNAHQIVHRAVTLADARFMGPAGGHHLPDLRGERAVVQIVGDVGQRRPRSLGIRLKIAPTAGV